jgi:hypothetical protein
MDERGSKRKVVGGDVKVAGGSEVSGTGRCGRAIGFRFPTPAPRRKPVQGLQRRLVYGVADSQSNWNSGCYSCMLLAAMAVIQRPSLLHLEASAPRLPAPRLPPAACLLAAEYWLCPKFAQHSLHSLHIACSGYSSCWTSLQFTSYTSVII